MRVLVQRSGKSTVKVNQKIVGKINDGMVVFVGFTEGDNTEKIKYLVNKILNLRIYPDEENIMNKSILDYGGSVLSISQFTLYADTKKGNRPSYIQAMNGEEANKLYDKFNEELRKKITVETGIFGADMEVNITNIGPTTIMMER